MPDRLQPDERAIYDAAADAEDDDTDLPVTVVQSDPMPRTPGGDPYDHRTDCRVWQGGGCSCPTDGDVTLYLDGGDDPSFDQIDDYLSAHFNARAVYQSETSRGAPLRLRMSVIEGAYVPELRCSHCGFWYIIDTENWEKNEWHMCLACKRMRAKLYARLKQADAEYRTQKAGKSRRYRKWLRENAPQYLPAYERERKARERARAQGYRDAQRDGAQ